MLSDNFAICATALESAGFGSWHEESSETAPFASLFVVFHIDEADRKYVLQGFDAREMAAMMGPTESDFPFGLLQLTFQFPFEVQQQHFPDVARLLHRLNNLLPVGSFLLAEDDRCVCHRTTIPAEDSGLPTETLVATIKIIQRFCIELSGLIEATSAGHMSYDDFLSELTKNLQ